MEWVQTSLTYFYLRSLVVAGPKLHCFPLIAPSSGAKRVLQPTTRPIMSFHAFILSSVTFPAHNSCQREIWFSCENREYVVMSAIVGNGWEMPETVIRIFIFALSRNDVISNTFLSEHMWTGGVSMLNVDVSHPRTWEYSSNWVRLFVGVCLQACMGVWGRDGKSGIPRQIQIHCFLYTCWTVSSLTFRQISKINHIKYLQNSSENLLQRHEVLQWLSLVRPGGQINHSKAQIKAFDLVAFTQTDRCLKRLQ